MRRTHTNTKARGTVEHVRSTDKKRAVMRNVKQVSIVVPPPPVKPWVLTEDEIVILKNAVCRGASDEELKYCLAVARRYELDPFQQQIWFVPRWDAEAERTDGKKGARVYVPVVGINGMLHIAARDHSDFGSYSEPEYGPMIDAFWTDKAGKQQRLQVPEWAKIECWKKGSEHPTVAKVWWDEIYPNVDHAPLVRRMPRLMLAKCAKAQATRTSYPKTGGLLIPEETHSREFSDMTPSGRLISPAEPKDVPGTAAAAKAMLEKRLAEYTAKEPMIQSPPHQTTAKGAASTSVPPERAAPSVQPKEGRNPDSAAPKTITVSWYPNKQRAYLTGNLAQWIDFIQVELKGVWQKPWWEIPAISVPILKESAEKSGWEVKEITLPPSWNPPTSQKGAEAPSQVNDPTGPKGSEKARRVTDAAPTSTIAKTGRGPLPGEQGRASRVDGPAPSAPSRGSEPESRRPHKPESGVQLSTPQPSSRGPMAPPPAQIPPLSFPSGGTVKNVIATKAGKAVGGHTVTESRQVLMCGIWYVCYAKHLWQHLEKARDQECEFVVEQKKPPVISGIKKIGKLLFDDLGPMRDLHDFPEQRNLL